MMTNQIRAIWY